MLLGKGLSKKRNLRLKIDDGQKNRNYTDRACFSYLNAVSFSNDFCLWF